MPEDGRLRHGERGQGSGDRRRMALVSTILSWTTSRGCRRTWPGATASFSRCAPYYYLRCLETAGFAIEEVTCRTIEARVDDWFEFLSAYHEAVLGRVGGSVKVDGLARPMPSATVWR